MEIYSDYLSTIKAAMNADPFQRGINEASQWGERSLQKGFSYEELNARIPKDRLQPGLKLFSQQLGLVPNFDQKPGLHPDFAYLKHTGEVENHYIVSMFVDIKGSTHLFRRYSPETVLVITNTIQRAAIHTCLIFGGFVHRLQGDGLFVYFGGRNISVREAVRRALQFASVFTYFVKHDIRSLFEQQGIEAIFTRIGIDLGYDEDVFWALAGVGEISEVTTCSLHTSLASKMQGHAASNGIVVGHHVAQESAEIAELFSPVSARTGEQRHRYIYQIPERKFNYTQYDFEWLAFLKRQSFIATDLLGNLHLKGSGAQSAPRVLANLAPVAAISKPYFG